MTEDNPALHALGIQGDNIKGHATGYALIFGAGQVTGKVAALAGQPEFATRPPGAVIHIGYLPYANHLFRSQLVLVNFLIFYLVILRIMKT